VIRRFLFLEVARVRQQDPGEIVGAAGRGDRPPEAVLEESRQVPDVVDVGVGQGDGVDARGIDRQLVPVPQAQGLQPLVEAAIHEEPAPVGLDQELRSGDRSGGAQTLHGGDRRAIGNDRPPCATWTGPRERTVPRGDYARASAPSNKTAAPAAASRP
jgi:hypothetical protein